MSSRSETRSPTVPPSARAQNAENRSGGRGFCLRWSTVGLGTVTYIAAFSACEKGGDRRLAMKPYGAMGLSKVERSTVTYSAAISAGETARQWRRALELLYAMGLVKLERNTITCSAATARARMAEAGSVRLRSSAQGGP